MNRIAVASAALAAMLLVSVSASAEPDGSAYTSGALRKLGRGIANIATCPAEVVRTAQLVGREKGVVAEASTGVLEGVWRTVLRGLAGIFEVGTFWVEVPKGFDPIMKPEYVWADSTWQE